MEPGELFTGGAPLEVDLGCGDGSFLLAMAREFPGRHFLGVERLLGRVRKVCRKADRDGLGNVRVLRLDARYCVEWLLPPGSVTRLHLLFPDPWPKARHHKRRLVNQGFLTALAAVLAPGGEFLFKTDHAEYFEWTAGELAACPHFTTCAWPDDAFFYPRTDFERQWRAAGRGIFKLRAVRAD
ncbi:MAG: tRNA (guanosine(46)-N7)-methyltransferase TrmB [Akkermansiaceae bacterium]|nr:tRNA (guanosine(46)-N7)-methyltransferase TrmB [Akkermansiaceae bacterium]